MKRTLLFIFALAAVVGLSFTNSSVLAAGNGFTHRILLDVDGEGYYLKGMPVGTDGASDIPGHYWNQTGPDRLVGKHYNTNYFWSPDADNGEYLYSVSGIIDEWTLENAEIYASRGYVHYHEMVSADTGDLHPSKVVFLKHTARTSFTFDHMGHNYEVTPGIDLMFPNNYMMPYTP